MKQFSNLLSKNNERHQALLESENRVSSRKEFFEYGKAILSKAHGDQYDEAKADAFLEDLIKKFGGESPDYGELVGIVQKSLRSNDEKLEESVELLIEAIVDNPRTPRFGQLDQISMIDPHKCLQVLASKHVKFVELLNTTEYDTKPLAESIGANDEAPFHYRIADPAHLVSICEALETSMIYMTGRAKRNVLYGNAQMDLRPFERFIDFTKGIRLNYIKDLQSLAGSMDSDKLIFDQFIRDNYNLYYFTPSMLVPKLQNPSYFVYLIMMYLDKFVDINYDILKDRGFNDSLELSSRALKAFKDRLGIVGPVVIDGRSVNYAKLYNAWEVATNLLSVIVDGGMKTNARIYLTKVKPMVDSIKIFSELRRALVARH